ncbi:MAG: RnfH family protein [Pseudomonadales bacterium]|nr:RnfH family protein [Pseudomonadales bacterium]
MESNYIDVEVAFALPHKQKIVAVKVKPGTSAYDAVIKSQIHTLFPEIDLEKGKMGIFGKAIKDPKNHELRAGDRVEIYRPLKIDPKQARVNRAKKGA